MSPIRVAIISAGPVGLTLARLLLNKPNVDFVVFESEKSRDARGQGGTLDLHPATGLAALKEAGLYDEFLERARFDGEELIICDKDLTKYVELSGSDENSSHGTPEIDRISLREMLLNCSFQ
jgi:2-polyprenyl-6-methoxyphenol hydroxylase-like FAD-dependent oxidoreductase